MKRILCFLMALLFPLCSFAAERPILVSVGIASNGQAAGIGKRAPWGIHEADIVYEIMMYETGQTRLTCLFQSQLPETVGPVRSARMSQFYLREEWDAAFVFCGDAGLQARNWMQPDLSLSSPLLLNFHHSQLLRRYAGREKGVKAPDNLSVQLSGLSAELPQSREKPVSQPAFKPNSNGIAVEEIVLDWGNDQWLTRLKYDANTHCFQMYRKDQPFVSYPSPHQRTAEQATPLCFSAIVIQHTAIEWLTSMVPASNGLGTGRADYLIEGKLVEGSWQRSHPSAPTCWLDADGLPLTLPEGKRYIAQFPETHTREINHERRILTYLHGGE